MSFLSPWFLAGALAVAVPIVLHLLRKDTAPAVDFSAVRFLRHAPREVRHPRRLHDLWLLAMRALAVLLLAFAFARPYLTARETAEARTVVVAVDTSFSMGAPGRFDRARDAARNALSGVRQGERMAVLRFDDHATAVSQPSVDRGGARAALADLAPGSGGTNYAAALSAVSRVLGPAGGRVVLITDLQRTWSGSFVGELPAGVGVEVVDVGGPLENVSVGPLRREGEAVTAQLTNHGVRSRTVTAVLSLNGRSIAEAATTIEPGRSAPAQFVVRLPSTGAIRVEVADREGLPADNERFLVIDPRPVPNVLLFGELARGADTFFLRRALEAADPSRGFTLQVVSADDRNQVSPARLREQHVVGVTGTRSLDRATRVAIADYVKGGGAVLLVASPALDSGTLGELLGDASLLKVESSGRATFPTTLAALDTRHPIFAAFGDAVSNLSEAEFRGALSVRPGPGGRVLARFTNGLPALVEQPVGRGRIMVFASDVGGEWNTFPRQPTFVPFAIETLRYLSDRPAEPDDMLVANVPPGAAARAGVIRVGDPPRSVAVNVDPRESAARRSSASELLAAIARVEAEPRLAAAAELERERSQALWRYVLVAMFVALGVEGLIGHRRLRAAAAGPISPPAQ
jgi:Aerotolerance regulator N-terminal/von Willebrand factor type A domain